MKIVVVEDEGITLKWLCKTIESYEKIDQLYTFSNGALALEFCLNHEVEVLITDIQMPVMDGLTLIEKVKYTKPDLQVVVLSAYDQFAYARQAMRLGVSEFLLKPEITSESLKECLDKIRRETKTIQEETIETRESVKYIENLLEKVITQNEMEIAQELNRYAISLTPNSLFVLVYQMIEKEEGEKLLELSEMLMEQELEAGVCQMQKENSVIIIANSNEKKISYFAQSLYNLLQQHGKSGICMGVSRVKDGFSHLPDLFRQASVSSQFGRFYGGHLCFYDTFSQNMICFYSEETLTNDCKKVRQLVGDFAYEEAYQKSAHVLNTIKEEMRLAPSAVRTLAVEFLMLYIQSIRNYKLSDEEARLLSEIDLNMINQKETVYELLEWWSRQVEHILKLLKLHQKAYSASIQTVIHYVREHFAGDIYLEQLAEKVYLSSSYLSTLFKKETGEYLSEYISKVRIQHACFLLTHESKSMEEVAELSGFSDVSYFSRIFKKHTGIKASEYREVK